MSQRSSNATQQERAHTQKFVEVFTFLYAGKHVLVILVVERHSEESVSLDMVNKAPLNCEGERGFLCHLTYCE